MFCGHSRTPGLSDARIAYHCARPGAIDDHRALMLSDLRMVPLPKRELQALDQARGATFYLADQLKPEAISGTLKTVSFPLAAQLRIALWQAAKGDKPRLSLPVETAGRATLHLVAVHRPDGASVRVLLDGSPLVAADGAQHIRLQSDYAPRVLNVNLKPVSLPAGSRELMIECVDAGVAGLDYLWIKGE